MKIFLLILATVFILAMTIYGSKDVEGGTTRMIALEIVSGICIACLWGMFYFQPFNEIPEYEPTPLDNVQEIILVGLDGNEFSFEIMEIE